MEAVRRFDKLSKIIKKSLIFITEKKTSRYRKQDIATRQQTGYIGEQTSKILIMMQLKLPQGHAGRTFT